MAPRAERRPQFKEVRKPASAFTADRLKFSAVQDRLRKPQDFSAEWWQQSLGVLRLIQRMGAVPQQVITDSPVGNDVPSVYSISDTSIRFMPQWRYVTVEGKSGSTNVFIDPVRTEQDRHAQEWREGLEKIAAEENKGRQAIMRRGLEMHDLGLRIEDAMLGLPPKVSATN